MNTNSLTEVELADEDDIILVDGEDMDLIGEDIDIVDDGSKQDEATNRFDCLVGALEDILLDPEFEIARTDFCSTNCIHFEDTDENKLIYMDLFKKYTDLVETYIEMKLKETVPGFDMQELMYLIDARKEELVSDVFDLLLSLGDFETFKEVMLSYKSEIQGLNRLEIQCRPMRIHTEEQEDGDQRPDLDFGLCVAPVRRY